MLFLDALITLTFLLKKKQNKKKFIWHKYLKASLIFPTNENPNIFLQAFAHFRQPQLQEHYMYLIIEGIYMFKRHPRVIHQS